MNKLIETSRITDILKSGMRVMIGGYTNCGVPNKIIKHIAQSGIKELCVITSDCHIKGKGIGLLIKNDCINRLIVSHVGLNTQAGEFIKAGKIKAELVPMGTFAERIRAAGAGIGGFLTKTGVGTQVQNGKQVLNLDGVDYLLEKPIFADVALVKASKIDLFGNMSYHGTTATYNTIMTMAANTVIAQADEIVEHLDPNEISASGIFVDYIVKND